MKNIIIIFFTLLTASRSDAQFLKKLGGDLKGDMNWKLRSKANQKADQAIDTLIAQPKRMKEKQKEKTNPGAATTTSTPSEQSETVLEKTESKNITATGQNTSAANITGDWKLMLETYDNNHNRILDDEERKKAFSNHYFYRFNPDGSCLINFTTSAKGAFKGHYTSSEKKGKKTIMIYMDEGGKSETQGGYTVISINKDEMVLLESTGDHTFWIFSRA
jgi:hypothetical protein